MDLTSIVIPTCNSMEHLKECVDAIRRYTETPYELIVADNGSTDGTIEYCTSEKLRFISLSANRGVVAACNIGMRLASGEGLLLLSCDVVVSHFWLDNMLACLSHQPEVGIVGPYANYANGKQRLSPSYTTVAGYHETSRRLNAPNLNQWLQVDRLGGFCLLIRRELYERIGELDERFSPGHYEDDYCYRARKAGYRLMIAGDVTLHRYGSVSFFKQDNGQPTQLAQNRRLFMNKWGVDP